jgi:hypothetical protein
MVTTHVNVDLDAVISTVTECLLNLIPIDEDHVHFLPANTEELDIDETWIDMQKEKHDEHHAHVYQYKDYLPWEIIHEVNAQDCYGFDPGTLQLVLIALKKLKLGDLAICQYFEPIVKGWIKLTKDRLDAKPSYDRLQKVEFKSRSGQSYKFVVEEFYGMKDDGSWYAQEDGCIGKIYLSKYNMGITHFPSNSLDFSKIPPLKGWFQNKFLYCWGSLKAPRDRFPPNFVNLQGFIDWLRNVFLNYSIEGDVKI